MKKIFFDVGAATGMSIEFFKKNYSKADEFEIYSFEPFPENLKELRKIPDIHVIPCAAWSSDTEIELFIGKAKSGTMYSDKTTGKVDPNNSIIVQGIDFAKFVKEVANEDDELWLKMNAEGAEYEIIPHLHRKGMIDWFNRTYIRWHSTKIPSVEYIHAEVKAMVPNNNNVWRKTSIIPL
jgi:FkbM family methyltransferase